MAEYIWHKDELNLRLPWIVPILFFTWFIGLGAYRVYFSPLAKFPGPRLAALTTWYQGYYDVFCRGQYVWRIKEMHARYGPIVRINPHEIHINDPEFIDEIFAGPSKPRDKYRWISRMLGSKLNHYICKDLTQTNSSARIGWNTAPRRAQDAKGSRESILLKG
ncbi:MAG: hypothetical protein Q9167_005529 [Letrouitia subvulpina]